MKIIATARVRDNEKIVGRFCEAYQGIADLILLADGGSKDRTVEIAESYPAVEVLHFDKRIDVNGGYWINPQGAHVNFLIDAAKARGADWITFDDSDCVPNFLIQWQARDRFELADSRGDRAVYSRRVYFIGDDEIYPKLHKPNTSIWAWRSDTEVSADEKDPLHLHMNLGDLRESAMHLEFPYCLLHYSWPSEEEAKAKVQWYRDSGIQPAANHPDNFGRPRAPADWFMSPKPPKAKRV